MPLGHLERAKPLAVVMNDTATCPAVAAAVVKSRQIVVAVTLAIGDLSGRGCEIKGGLPSVDPRAPSLGKTEGAPTV